MKRHSPLLVNAASSLIGGFLLCLAAIPWLARENWTAPLGLAWSALLYSGLASIVVGNVFWFTAINRVGAARGRNTCARAKPPETR